MTLAGGRVVRVRCYLCGMKVPKERTEITRYRVASAARGGTVQGVNRYVRKCVPYCGAKP